MASVASVSAFHRRKKHKADHDEDGIGEPVEDTGEPVEDDIGEPFEDMGEPVEAAAAAEAPAASPQPQLAAPAPPPAAAGPSGQSGLDALARGLVEVRHTGSAKGMGLFARQELPDNTWVGDYAGEVLTQEQYLRRYPNEDAQYVLAANTDYNIDAADEKRSGFLRYANHSSAFNMFFDVLRVRGKREKQVKFYTARRVAAGEELVFDYGRAYWDDRGLRPLP